MAENVGFELVVTSNKEGLDEAQIRRVLAESVRSRTYQLPEGLGIETRLTEANGDEKTWGDWPSMLRDSAKYGPGFDSMIGQYLGAEAPEAPESVAEEMEEERLEREEKREEKKAKRRACKRKDASAKRSKAAKKGWRKRRAKSRHHRRGRARKVSGAHRRARKRGKAAKPIRKRGRGKRGRR